ncbi:fatty acyl-CoA reductase wat-like isoform X2 [Zophobas morio]|uniref:fatty acyl-CoA reductase wat-like isoform X2 n=1 Tax=Zophobas morio TaxID=2755281 RepID=UPI0030833F34
MSASEIYKFYNDQNVFITGGSGFVGKVLIEKLLRSTNVRTIYVLIRPKKECDAQKRFHNIFDNILFEKLKSEQPEFRNRVVPIHGDCTTTNLGISEKDNERLKSEVNIVFHVAAAIFFNQHISTAYAINCKGTENVLSLCKEMSVLKVFIHVSTAYSNCNRPYVDEIIYDTPSKYTQVENLLNRLTLKEARKLTPKLLESWPNTYTFTKALAENLVRDKSGNFRVGIFRPGVTSTYKEPLENWSDSNSGPNFVIRCASLGYIQIFSATHSRIELVPADLTIAALIATAWDVYCNQDKDKLPIYNYVTSNDNSLTICELFSVVCLQLRNYPSNKAVWVPNFRTVEGSPMVYFFIFCYHMILGLILDFLRLLCFQKPKIFMVMLKTQLIIKDLYYFSVREWNFSNKNVKDMWGQMNEVDKHLFNFDMGSVQWIYYLRNYFKGLRVYLMKETLEAVPEAKTRMKRLEFLQYVVHFLVIFFGISTILMLLSNLYC